jgi:hypothetical protein
MPFQTINGDPTDIFTDIQENLHQQLNPGRKVVNAFMAEAQVHDSAQGTNGDYQNDTDEDGAVTTIDNLIDVDNVQHSQMGSRKAAAGRPGNTMSMAIDSKL